MHFYIFHILKRIFLACLLSGLLAGVGHAAPCNICFEDKPATELMVEHDNDQGHHAFCTQCIIQTIQKSFHETGQVRCPEPGCAEPLDLELIEEKVRTLYQQDPSLIDANFWEISSPDGSLQIGKMQSLGISVARHDVGQVLCPECQQAYPKTEIRQRFCANEECKFGPESDGFCQSCNTRYHFHGSCPIDQTVRDWQAPTKTPTRDQAWLKANARACPHCHLIFVKNEGCNVMKCGQDFHDARGQGCGQKFLYDGPSRDLVLVSLPITDAILQKNQPSSTSRWASFVGELTLIEPLNEPDNLFLTEDGITSCNHCNENIHSIKFQCIHCKNFALCQQCAETHWKKTTKTGEAYLSSGFLNRLFRSAEIHPPDHAFIKEYSPRQEQHLSDVLIQLSQIVDPTEEPATVPPAAAPPQANDMERNPPHTPDLRNLHNRAKLVSTQCVVTSSWFIGWLAPALTVASGTAGLYISIGSMVIPLAGANCLNCCSADPHGEIHCLARPMTHACLHRGCSMRAFTREDQATLQRERIEVMTALSRKLPGPVSRGVVRVVCCPFIIAAHM